MVSAPLKNLSAHADVTPVVSAPIACPVCESIGAKELVFHVTKEEAAQHFVLAQGDTERNSRLSELIGSLWNGPNCDVVRCGDCDLVFAWPFVAGNGEFYNLAYPNAAHPRTKWEYDKTVSALERMNASGGKVLEVGSAFGYFLEKISPRFFQPESIVATEYHDVPRQALAERGYQVFDCDIRSQPFDQFEGTFKFIFMFQVLEHMDDMQRLINRISRLAAPDADLFIAVPEPAGIDYWERHGGALDMPPNHISRWSEQAFKAFAKRIGFEIVEFQNEKITFTAFIKADIGSSYLRRAQRGGSIANHVRSLPRSRTRKLAELSLALAAAPSRAPIWFATARDRKEFPGGSIWVHLQRKR